MVGLSRTKKGFLFQQPNAHIFNKAFRSWKEKWQFVRQAVRVCALNKKPNRPS